MAKLLLGVFVVILCNSFCQSAVVAAKKSDVRADARSKRTADQITDLKNKLSQLKQMLDKLDKDKASKDSPVTTEAPEKPVVSEQESHSGDNTLSPQDKLLLKSLKAALEKMDYEDKVDRKQRIPAKRTNSETFADTKGGHFGGFSDNSNKIIPKIVERLLSDLDFALRNGVTVEDIISYLYEMEKAVRQRQQRNRIEDEEKQLKALLNQEPHPRD